MKGNLHAVFRILLLFSSMRRTRKTNVDAQQLMSPLSDNLSSSENQKATKELTDEEEMIHSHHSNFERKMKEKSILRKNTHHTTAQNGSLLGNNQKLVDENFFDFAALSDDEKMKIMKMAYNLEKYSGYIDWEKKRSEYTKMAPNPNFISHSTHINHATTAEASSLEPSLRGGRTIPSIDYRHRKLQATIDGDVFEQYRYSKGNCPSKGSLGVPCAPDNLDQLCDKYNRQVGSFRDCLDACEPAVCCFHDAPPETNFLAPSCSTDENCDQYNFCYIAWWKLHDTIGPHLFLRIEQVDDFYDIPNEDISPDSTGMEFFEQLFFHHWDNIQPIIEAGTVDGQFLADRIFLNPDFWDPSE